MEGLRLRQVAKRVGGRGGVHDVYVLEYVSGDQVEALMLIRHYVEYTFDEVPLEIVPTADIAINPAEEVT